MYYQTEWLVFVFINIAGSRLLLFSRFASVVVVGPSLWLAVKSVVAVCKDLTDQGTRVKKSAIQSDTKRGSNINRNAKNIP